MRTMPLLIIVLAGLSGCASVNGQPAPTAIAAPADGRWQLTAMVFTKLLGE